jgi:hypothetical protein
MTDTNWQSYYGDNPDTSGFVNPPNPQDYDDIMKFSDCTNAVINGRYIVAGRENCVDAVRGANYEWRACSLASGAGVSCRDDQGGYRRLAIHRLHHWARQSRPTSSLGSSTTTGRRGASLRATG